MTGATSTPYIGRAIAADGVGTVLATRSAARPTTTYAENIGVMAATRIYSTAAYYVAAIVAILFGLCPKFGALVAATPGGVLGGITVVLYGMIGLLGAKIWIENRVDFGNPVNLVPLAAGIIIAHRQRHAEDHRRLLALSGIALGTIVALVGYHLAGCSRRRRCGTALQRDGARRHSAAGPRSRARADEDRRRSPRSTSRRPAPAPGARRDHGRGHARPVKPLPFGYPDARHARGGAGRPRRVGADGKVLAGGQSLIPLLNMRLAAPATWSTSTGSPSSTTSRSPPTACGSARWPGTRRSMRDEPRRRSAAAAPGAAARRAPGDPQPRHHGRQPRARRPGRRDDRRARPAGRHGRGGQPAAADDVGGATSSPGRWSPRCGRRARRRGRLLPGAAAALGYRVRRGGPPARRLRDVRRRRASSRWTTTAGRLGPGGLRLGRAGPRSCSTSTDAVRGRRRDRRLGRRRRLARDAASTPRPTSTRAPTTGAPGRRAHRTGPGAGGAAEAAGRAA